MLNAHPAHRHTHTHDYIENADTKVASVAAATRQLSIASISNAVFAMVTELRNKI